MILHRSRKGKEVVLVSLSLRPARIAHNIYQVRFTDSPPQSSRSVLCARCSNKLRLYLTRVNVTHPRRKPVDGHDLTGAHSSVRGALSYSRYMATSPAHVQQDNIRTWHQDNREPVLRITWRKGWLQGCSRGSSQHARINQQDASDERIDAVACSLG